MVIHFALTYKYFLPVGRKKLTGRRIFRSGEAVIGIIFNGSIGCLEEYSMSPSLLYPCNNISCTLRSGLLEIPIMIRTFPHGLENNHTCKWTLDNFPGILTYVFILENCQKSIFMHGYSPIHVDRSLRVSNLGDKSVPYL